MIPTIEKVMSHHKKIALYYSGGKDSTVLLDIMKPWWDKLTVVWLNTGDAPQDLIRHMEGVEKLVPNFLEVVGHQPRVVKEHGLPSDIITPENMYPYNQIVHPDSVKIQTRYQCCDLAAWAPLQRAIEAHDFTLLIRGQKNEDQLRNHIVDGVFDKVEIFNPIQNMTTTEVFTYIQKHNLPLLSHYDFGKASIDCCTCTAYLEEMPRKINYLRAFEPDKVDTYLDRLSLIASTSYPHINAFIKATDRAFPE